MKIGAMTNPQRDLADELRQMAVEGFDFADITLEAPRAEPGQIDIAATRRLLDDLGLGVICHAAPYLPVHNPSALARRPGRAAPVVGRGGRPGRTPADHALHGLSRLLAGKRRL